MRGENKEVLAAPPPGQREEAIFSKTNNGVYQLDKQNGSDL